MPIVPEAPTLDASEIAAEQDRFLNAVSRELIIRGDASDATTALMHAMREHLVVTPYTSGIHETKFRAPSGRLKAPEAAAWIAETAATNAQLAAFGPDPRELLAKRLQALGIPAAESRTIAARRVERLLDGRVAVRGPDGTVLYNSGPVPDPERTYTDAERAAFTDPNRAVTMATRAIIGERDRAASGQTSHSSIPGRF